MADSEVSSGPEDGVDQAVANVSGTPAVLAPLPGAGDIALPNVESQTAQANQTSTQSTPSEVLVAGGTFNNPILGSHTSTSYHEEKHYENSTVNEVHHHYHDSAGNQEASTSGLQPSKRQRVEENSELEEGFIRICRDVIMYEKEPIREGTNIYEGYQEHVSADGPPTRLPVAIKKIVSSTNKHKQEVKHLVTLASHPGVVRIIRSKEHKTTHARVLYIIMELCSLQNLHDYLTEIRENGTPFDFNKILAFTKQLLDGMKHIHDNEVIHRDVKPENILLSTNKAQLKFTDFGLGKELHQGRSSTKVTIKGQGTEGYRAPETYFSDKVSKSADIFSFGITLFSLWSNGNHPYGANILLRDNNIVTNTNRDFSGLLLTGDLKEEFLDLISLMLQHDPNLRPTIDQVIRHTFFKHAARRGRIGQQIPVPPVFGQQGVEPNQAADEDFENTVSSSGTSQPNVEGAVALGGRTHFASEEQASRLRREHKYDEAILELQDLEPNERQQTMLAECYFHVGKDAEALECMERLKAIMLASADRLKPDIAIKRVETYIDNSLFLQALVLLPSVAELCKQEPIPKDALWGLVLCVWRGSSIVKSLYTQDGRMRVISNTVAIQLLHRIYGDLKDFTGADDDTKADMASRCLNDIGSAYMGIEKYEEAIRFFQQGIDTMKNCLGSNAPKYSVFKRLHNNLGVVQYRLGNYDVAEKCLIESIRLSELAEDYPSEEEKKKATDQGRLILRRIQAQIQESQNV